MTIPTISGQLIGGVTVKRDQPELMTDGSSATFSSNQLMKADFTNLACAGCVSFLRARRKSLWLAKLAKSSREAIADGSSESISAVVEKLINATTTTEQCTAA